MRSHRDLDVWKRGIALVTEIYGLTKLSVPSNIAEGAARDSQKEFLRFLAISLGSLAELETQMLIAAHLQYLPADNSVGPEIDRIRQMIHGLIHAIKRQQRT